MRNRVVSLHRLLRRFNIEFSRLLRRLQNTKHREFIAQHVVREIAREGNSNVYHVTIRVLRV